MTMKVAATDDPMPADATGSGGVKRVKLDSIDLVSPFRCIVQNHHPFYAYAS